MIDAEFPAGAGMNRENPLGNAWIPGVPRRRGDEPLADRMLRAISGSSPQARG